MVSSSLIGWWHVHAIKLLLQNEHYLARYQPAKPL